MCALLGALGCGIPAGGGDDDTTASSAATTSAAGSAGTGASGASGGEPATSGSMADGSSGSESGESESGESESGGSESGGSDTAVGDPWAPVRAVLEASEVADLAVLIGDASGNRFVFTKGAVDVDTPMPSASAIKWVTSATILRLVEQGVVALDDHPQRYLEWWTDDPADPRSEVTIAQLLSFTSGFRGTPLGPMSPPCASDGATTIDACAQEIYETMFFDPPGTVYFYGPSHMQLLASIVQAATGRPWAEIFEEHLADELGMADTRYVSPSESNPRVSGGASTTAADLERFADAMRRHTEWPTTWNVMIEDHTPSGAVARGFAPFDDYEWHYGLGVWRECPFAVWDPSCDSPQILSTTGAKGAHAWVDVPRDYYGVLMMDEGLGGSLVAIELALEVRPLVIEALAAS